MISKYITYQLWRYEAYSKDRSKIKQQCFVGELTCIVLLPFLNNAFEIDDPNI